MSLSSVVTALYAPASRLATERPLIEEDRMPFERLLRPVPIVSAHLNKTDASKS